MKPKQILLALVDLQNRSTTDEGLKPAVKALTEYFDLVNVPKCGGPDKCEIDSKQDYPECPKCGFTVPF